MLRNDSSEPRRVLRSGGVRRSNSYAILLACVTLYTITQLPNVLYKILQVASRPPYCSYKMSPASDAAARPVVTILLYTNYTVNFVVYCFVSSNFRRSLSTIVLHLKRKHGRKNHTGSDHKAAKAPSKEPTAEISLREGLSPDRAAVENGVIASKVTPPLQKTGHPAIDHENDSSDESGPVA